MRSLRPRACVRALAWVALGLGLRGCTPRYGADASAPTPDASPAAVPRGDIGDAGARESARPEGPYELCQRERSAKTEGGRRGILWALGASGVVPPFWNVDSWGPDCSFISRSSSGIVGDDGELYASCEQSVPRDWARARRRARVWITRPQACPERSPGVLAAAARALQARFDRVERCHDTSRARVHWAAGDYEVSLGIRPGVSPTRVVVRGRPTDAAFAACLAAAFEDVTLARGPAVALDVWIHTRPDVR